LAEDGPNAFILLDDYGFLSYEEQKQGFDAFAAERGTSVRALPSGQGLIYQGRPAGILTAF
jgi:hypothetical protein